MKQQFSHSAFGGAFPKKLKKPIVMLLLNAISRFNPFTSVVDYYS